MKPKTVLLDASSAILLHKADLLIAIQAAFRVCLADAVYEELTRHHRPGARAVAQSCRNRHLNIVKPRGSYPLPASLHRGERDTLRCFLDGGADFIVIDDGRGAGYCRRQSIPYVNALLCPRLLAASGRLSAKEAHASMDAIANLGRYSDGVKHYAAACSTRSLTAFLP